MEADEVLHRGVTIVHDQLGDSHYKMAVLTNSLGDLALKRGAYTDATDQYAKALTIFRDQLGDHEEVAEVLNSLGTVALLGGKLDQAKILVESSLKIIEKIFGVDHPKYFTYKNNLLKVTQAQKRAATN